MPRLQAAVPAGAPPNALLRVRLPDGQEVTVRVPDGLKPGDEFIFEVPSIGGTSKNIDNLKGNTNKRGVDSSTTSVGGCVTPEKKYERSSSQLPSNKKKQSSSKNPKKRSNAESSSRKDQVVENNGEARSFMVGFLELYNQIYDSLTQQHCDTQSTSRQGNQRQSHNSRRNSQSGRIHQGNTYRLGFLDREIINGKDFLTALAVGMFIGLSIVFGFIVGVLAVTPIK
mmetsp:Transcript_25109/g.52887  ORF Transcript_25109/g.52887 Transcript_25109/m.52887 type:complete len:227 (-) Transcript_25109:217-897(-)